VATSYPKILSRFFEQNNITAEIEEISGSVEIAPGIGLADAICDIVSTGSTLFTNGLKEVDSVIESQAILIANPHLSAEKNEILNRLLFRIKAVRNAREHKYIMLNTTRENVPAICKILPGINSPTLIPLAQEGWCSLHSVIKEDQFWEIIDQLKQAGAEGILVSPIEKMIF
jgi:ATP phosphoribosyltransferase